MARQTQVTSGYRSHKARANDERELRLYSAILTLLLDVLVCSMAICVVSLFVSLFVFFLALRARQNTAQLVKIYSDTTHQNV